MESYDQSHEYFFAVIEETTARLPFAGAMLGGLGGVLKKMPYLV